MAYHAAWRLNLPDTFEQQLPEYVTVGFIARRCGVSNTTVLRWIERGQLTAFRLPAGHYRIDSQNFAKFLTSFNIPVPDKASKTADG